MSASVKPKLNVSSLVACMVNMFCVGLVYLWSVFRTPVVEHYGWDPDAVTLISSAMIVMYVFGTLIGGFIQDRTSPRFVSWIGAFIYFAGLFTTSLLSASTPWLIYITYGVLAGIGVGFVYSAALSTVQKLMPHRRGFATGISVGSFGLSVVVFSPVIERLLENVGVPMTFRFMAIALVIVLLISSYFIKNPTKEYLDSLKLPARQSNRRQYRPSEVLRRPEFWCMALSLFFLPATYMIVIPLVKDLAIARGIPSAQASFTVQLVGISSVVSRIIGSTLSDKLGRARTILAMAILTCIAAIMMTFAKGILYSVVIVLIVFGYSAPAGIFPAMSTDAFGTKYSGTNYGFAFMFLGFSSPVFSWLATVLNKDGMATGNFTRSFLVAAAVCIIPIVLLPLFDFFVKRRAD
ncbi:MAG: OFA family MFS transporter [Oscillospiraceae bacterium]|jgi:OFA family oxalate/formate antiporter-like MFS transporter